MARFMMTRKFHYGSVVVAAGKTLADSAANAQPGDFVYTALNSGNVPAGAIALDASATSMLNASRWAGVAWGAPSGVDSVGG
jgi:hypothetical protein